MLLIDNSIELPSSKFRVVFGHISAYDYLNSIYPETIKIRENENAMVSEVHSCIPLYIVKYFLLPKEDGKYIRVRDIHAMQRILNNLDEIDWQTIGELMKIMIEPYQLIYRVKDIVCPQCKTKSDIHIDKMDRMLFIVAQSLNNVTVTLKRN